MTSSGKITGNWNEFLQSAENKKELFTFLTEGLQLLALPEGKCIYANSGQKTVCISSSGLDPLPDCTHEEADTRIFVHLDHAVKDGHTDITIRTVDSDVVIIAILVAAQLPVRLWIAFGKGEHFRYLAAHECALALGRDKSLALPFFHAFTGCDTVSCFSTVSKKTAWKTWQAYDQVTKAFTDISYERLSPSEDNLALLERFVALLYDRTSNETTVNGARLFLFTKKLREIENIPPT